MKNIKKFFIIFLLIFGIIISASGCSFAGGVPKYNPKDPNPKPGLYRLDNVNYERSWLSLALLNDGRILMTGRTPNNNKGAEIFNPKTGKFTKIGNSNYYIAKSLKMSNGQILLLGLEPLGYLRYACFEKFDPKTNKFIDTKACVKQFNYTNADLYELGNDKYALYLINASFKKSMFIYDSRNNTLSDKPIKEGDPDYISLHKLQITKDREFAFNASDEYKKVMLEKVKKEIGGFNKLLLSDDKVLVFAVDYVDYGVHVSPEDEKKFRYSWFSPMYEYSIKNQTLTPINEYKRWEYASYIPLGNERKVLILPRIIPWYGKKYANQKPENVPYDIRIYRGTAGVCSRQAYIYVY